MQRDHRCLHFYMTSSAQSKNNPNLIKIKITKAGRKGLFELLPSLKFFLSSCPFASLHLLVFSPFFFFFLVFSNFFPPPGGPGIDFLKNDESWHHHRTSTTGARRQEIQEGWGHNWDLWIKFVCARAENARSCSQVHRGEAGRAQLEVKTPRTSFEHQKIH